MGEASFTERVLQLISRNRHLDQLTMKAILKANELLGLAMGVRLAALRDSGDPLQEAFAEAETNLLLARCSDEVSELLGLRWDKIPGKHRPQFTPEQRYRILRLKRLFAWSRVETARRLRISAESVARWEREVDLKLEAPARPLVQTNPPVRRFADVVRELVHTAPLRFRWLPDDRPNPGARRLELSKRSVARILREKPPERALNQSAAAPKKRFLRARFPNHIFLVDLTDIPALFGILRFKLALILDVFSRFPLGVRFFQKEPSADDITVLLRQTTTRFGNSRHFVSDKGSQFTSSLFRETLASLGIRQRFGAIGQYGSIALLERFWRTLKAILSLKAFPPLVERELEYRLELALFFYTFFRPHQGPRRRDARRDLLRAQARPSLCRPASSGPPSRGPIRCFVQHRVHRSRKEAPLSRESRLNSESVLDPPS